MPVEKFMKWKQKVLLGAKREGHRSDRGVRSDEAGQLGHEPVVVQAGVRLFATAGKMGTDVLCGSVVLHDTNNDFWSRNIYYPGTRSQTQNPIGSFEGHLKEKLASHDCGRRWMAISGSGLR